jgi:probable HAF family extracellular repeat protein
LGELPGDGFSEALAINNHDKAAGYSGIVISFDPFVVEYHAVIWHKSQVFSLPPLPEGGKADIVTDVNDRGQVVGFSGPEFGFEHPALWYRGSLRDLGLIGGDWAQAIAISEKGQVVGYGATADGSIHAFTWKNGVITDLGVLNEGDQFSGAFDINQKRQIVGFSGADIADVTSSRALLWDRA